MTDEVMEDVPVALMAQQASGPSGTPTSVATNIPWVEKYRPKELTHVSHHKEIVSTLQNAVETNRLPHLLFYGPPGTGKTSVALALCRTLYSPDQLRNRVLELNASDERGISVVRDKIKGFASLAVGDVGPSTGASRGKTPSGMGYFAKKRAEQEAAKTASAEGDYHVGTAKEPAKIYPNPPYKIIILDEADTVTTDAQSALRRIIEATSRVTRFILICNYVTRIIEPLASRCAKFRFQPLPVESMQQRLHYIAEREQCELSDAVRQKILSIAGGDMRRAVTTLQSAHMLSHSVESSSDFTDEQKLDDRKESTVDMSVDLIEEMAGFPPVSLMNVLWEGIQSLDFATLECCVREDILTEGFSIPSILNLVSERLISSAELSDMTKADVSIAIAEADKFLIDGADDYLQLMNVCALLMGRITTDKEIKQ